MTTASNPAAGATPADTAPYHIVGASVQGVSHLRADQPCQDAHAYAFLPGSALVVAVADGAGSAPQGGEGAQAAVATAVAAVRTALTRYRPTSHRAWQVVAQTAFQVAQDALTAQAAAQAQPVRVLATTLLLLILTEEATVGAAVGDCVAVIQTAAGELVTLCPPQRGEYANTTNFITQADLRDLLTVAWWPGAVTGAALFSDGLAPLAISLTHYAPHAPFFEPLLAFVAAADDVETATTQLVEFLNSARVNARTDDDKTLVLVRRLD